jgi:hypothetical protein
MRTAKKDLISTLFMFDIIFSVSSLWHVFLGVFISWLADRNNILIIHLEFNFA